jgi:CMP-N-acetylneuraminic acid synthetase
MKIIIPARLGSKGLPFKNRKLFKYTADSIPKELSSNVWVTSDDLEIINLALDYKFNTIVRPSEISQDSTSTLEVINHALSIIECDPFEEIVMLYLTYPQRTWFEVEKALSFFNRENASSLLCKKEIKTHPYLMMYELENNLGKQIVKHNLYRRQDYPTCFEISHYISIFKPSSINNLNNNLYSEETVFFPISSVIDIDTLDDLNEFRKF